MCCMHCTCCCTWTTPGNAHSKQQQNEFLLDNVMGQHSTLLCNAKAAASCPAPYALAQLDNNHAKTAHAMDSRHP